MALNFFFKWPLLLLPFIKGAASSVGDNSPFYGNCVKKCEIEICNTGKESVFSYNVWGFGFSLWSCLENCEYECQWKTVEAFQRKNWAVPQFNGKWPFIRLFGFQEPASVLFSILNFFTVLKSYLNFKQKVAKSSPYYNVWSIYSWVLLNGWVWSTIYHSRETPLTEKMDYMSAFLLILYSFYGAGLRYISNSFNLKTLIWTIFCGILGLNHLAYLWLFDFDYGYNMQLNCAIGGITVLLWFLWTFLQFNTQPFIWKIFLFAVGVTFSTLLEVLDFPPIFWFLDAHALWHASTIPVNYIFYKYVIDDCNYLHSLESFSSQKKQ